MRVTVSRHAPKSVRRSSLVGVQPASLPARKPLASDKKIELKLTRKCTKMLIHIGERKVDSVRAG